MSQQIKCPHCSKLFPIEESFKHEAEEYRKKIQLEEEKKSIELQREFENEYNQKEKKQNKAHAKEIEKIKAETEKKQKEEVQKQATDQIQKAKLEIERKAKEDKQELEKKMSEMKKTHQIDMDRMRKANEAAARAASQSPVERKGEVQEELLEEFLNKEFPSDKFEPVKKGQRGGDVIQSIIIKDETVGKILYECKDVFNFDEKWVQKLLDDMSRVNATIGFIFTKAMPKKSNGLVEDREGGRIIICSDYPILRQLVSVYRKFIQLQFNSKSLGSRITSKLQNLHDYLSGNEFKLQYRKIINGLRKESEQIDRDERSYENQIKNRKINLDENKKNINGVVTSLITNAGLSIEDDDLRLE